MEAAAFIEIFTVFLIPISRYHLHLVAALQAARLPAFLFRPSAPLAYCGRPETDFGKYLAPALYVITTPGIV